MPEVAAELLSLSEDDLFAIVGDEVASHQGLALPMSRPQKATLGRSWLDRNFEELSKKICSAALLKDLSTESDTKALALALLPMLGLATETVSAVVVAVLIARIGLRRFCAKEWKTD